MRLRARWCVASTGGVACLFVFSLAIITLLATTACEVERRKSDAELGLNPQQAAGRKIYDAECARCHEPYSTRGRKGPGLKGYFSANICR